MKKLLIISETWYPDSRATISIMTRIAEEIAQKGIEVYAAPLKPLANGEQYPSEHNGVKILTLNTDCSKTVGQKLRMLLQKAIQKLLYAEKRLLIKDRECKWNYWIGRLREYQRIRWYQPVCEKSVCICEAKEISAIIDRYKFDSVISVSLPFCVHSATAIAMGMRKKTGIIWIPISFDPYAYDQSIDRREQKRRIRKEHKTFRTARKILMLSQSKHDYLSDTMLGNMEFFEIPNVRKLEPKNTSEMIPLNDGRIHCVFIGNLYWTVRNPECLFSLFEQFSNDRICLHVIGSLSYDFPKEYMSQWIDRMGKKLLYHGRISAEDAVAVMNQADVLINIGNTTSNQCPSKVLEYISTGKPILSISKIDNCTSEAYLTRYPLACIVSEKECERPEMVARVEEFIVHKHLEHVDFEMVNSIYCDCTIDKSIELLMNLLNY